MNDRPEPVALVALIEGLITSFKTAFHSELAFQRARGTLASQLVARIAIMGALALMLAFFCLMALVVGLLLALAPLLGAWLALGAMLGSLLLGVALAACLALRAWRRLQRVIYGGDGR